MFNIKLYKDMFKQLRMSGMIMTILSILISCYPPISQLLESTGYSIDNGPLDYGHVTKLVDISPILVYVAFICGALLTLIAFSFLNKRNSSDYYHSLPNTRVCTFLSIFAAITTWILIIVVSTVLIPSAVYFACGQGFNPIYIVYLICAYTASSLLVASVTAVAMSITGTLFSNIVLAGLIGFLPRLIFTFIALLVESLAPIARISSLGLLNPKYNLPVSFVISIFDNSVAIDDLLSFKGGIVYTFIFALLYVGLACFLFHIRKSEAADKNAPNKILQHIFRCAISLPLVLMATISAINVSKFTKESIVFLIAALAVYFIYELITTKSLKKMIVSAPYFLVVIAVSLGISYSSYFISESILSQAPSSQEIEYVQFTNHSRAGDRTYKAYQLSQIKYDNVVIKDLVSKLLAKNIESAKNDDYRYYDSASKVDVLIKLGNKKIYRSILFPTKDLQTVTQIKEANAIYLSRLRSLPTDKEITLVKSFGLSAQESRNLFNSYRQELDQLSDEQTLQINVDSTAANSATAQLSPMIFRRDLLRSQPITINSVIGVKHYRDQLNFNEYLPKTSMMYCSIINKRNVKRYDDNLDYILSYNLQTAKEEDRFTVSISESSVNSPSNNINLGCEVNRDTYISDITFKKIIEILSILKESSTENIDITKSYFSIEIETPIQNNTEQYRSPASGSFNTNIMYVQATSEQLAEINKIISR